MDASTTKAAEDMNSRRKQRSQEAIAFGLSVRRERKARGWTQKELERRSGIAQPVISVIEKGKEWRRLDASTFIALIEAFEMSPRSLIEGASHTPSDELTACTDLWHKLTPEHRAAWIAAGRALAATQPPKMAQRLVEPETTTKTTRA